MGYGRAKLAELLEIGETNIPLYEANKRTPSSDVVAKMAVFFNVSTDYLMGLSDDPNSPVRDSNISPDELKVLALYRATTSENRQKIIGVLEIMTGHSETGV